MTSTSTPSTRPVVALMTDFGTSDGYVGVMKGVIARTAPESHVLDITHEIAHQNVISGAWVLSCAYRYFPEGTVFVCVVDPGVGSPRNPLAIHGGAWFFVGPDNGLFSSILADETIHGVVKLSNPTYHLPLTSSTFHGRDIFAPVGAHLARSAGSIFSDLGPALSPATLVQLPSAPAQRHGTLIEGHVIHVDTFGNLITSIPLTMVPELFTAASVHLTFPASGLTVTQRRRFFAQGTADEQPFIYGDSSNYLGVAVRDGNAASILAIGYGAPVTFDTSR